jgi:hypothetical protein
MNPNQKKEAARAVQDLENIAKLRKFPPFTDYYQRRLVGEIQRLRDSILHDRELNKDRLWEERLKFLQAYDILALTAQDEASCRSMLDALPREEEPEATEER